MPKAKGARRGSSSSSSSSSSDDERKKGGAIRKEKKSSKDLPKVSRSELREFRKDALATHNKYRKEHQVDPLKMSDVLNRSARRWAKHLAKHDKFENSQRSDIGECVGMHFSSITTEYSGEAVSDHWYSELRKYDFKKPGNQNGTGNFSQMVWKGSKEFGIGKAITKGNKVIVVAHYNPPGNYIGEYDKNVFPRKDGYIPPEVQKKVTRVVRQEDPEKIKRDKEREEAMKKIKGMKLDDPDLSPKDLKKFQKDALEAQNKIRKKHDAKPLKQSKELEKRAQDWAAHLAKNDEFKNSGETDIGENVAMHYNSASTDFSGEQAVKMWYKAKDKYNFKKPGFTSGAGQFTQMVWKDSKEFGAGKAVTKEGKVILVGFYKPPGNMMPEKFFKENVEDCDSSSSDSD